MRWATPAEPFTGPPLNRSSGWQTLAAVFPTHPRISALGWLAAAVLLSCGGDFVEPNPPALEWLDQRRVVQTRFEPVVLAVVVDLSIRDEESCAEVIAALRDVHREAATEPVRNALMVPPVVLTPGCEQTRDRRLPESLREELERAVAELPGHEVRPVVLYVNNLDVPLSSGLAADLKALRQPLSNGQAPVLWGVVLPAVEAQLDLEILHPWTWARDPALLPAIRDGLDARLPPWSEEPLERVDLLPADVRARAHAVKVCDHSSALSAGSVPVDGSAVSLEEVGDPYLSVGGPPRERARIGPLTPPRELTWRVEVCGGHCDRTVRGEHGALGPRWSRSVGCTREVSP